MKFIVWMARRSATVVLYVQGFLVNMNHPGEGALAPSKATWPHSNPSACNPKQYTLKFKHQTLTLEWSPSNPWTLNL